MEIDFKTPQTRLGRNALEEDVKGAAQEIAELGTGNCQNNRDTLGRHPMCAAMDELANAANVGRAFQ